MSRHEVGQAQIEFVGSLPLLIAVGAIVLQLLAVGWSQSLADGAAEAGAIAVVDGREPREAARAAVPGWAEKRVEVDREGGRVEVRLRPPALVPGLGRRLEVASSAWVAPGGGG